MPDPLTTLYICYFGLDEPLVQTQVLPYLRELRRRGVAIHLLTFDRHERSASAAAVAEQLAADAIAWTSRRYHSRPSVPATLYDIVSGAAAIVRLARRHRVNVLHARSHVPAAMALLALSLLNCHLIFDIRGLMADEYVDGSVWRMGSTVYRAVKGLERVAIRRADQIVVLTRLMRDWILGLGLAPRERIEVIPCCVDVKRFAPSRPTTTDHLGERREVVYAGSTTGLYLFEEVGRLFLAMRALDAGAFLRVLTPSSQAGARDVLRRVGVAESDFAIVHASPHEVPRYLQRARVGLSLRKPTFSQIAASPTKIPEYLAAGIPVVCNAGIGDMDTLLSAERVGVILSEFSAVAYQRAAVEAFALSSDPRTRERCLAVAREQFDLERVGGVRYMAVYERLQ